MDALVTDMTHSVVPTDQFLLGFTQVRTTLFITILKYKQTVLCITLQTSY
jgi:hypothetical protein